MRSANAVQVSKTDLFYRSDFIVLVMYASTSCTSSLITTEGTLNRGLKSDFDRMRIRAFVSRNDFIEQLQAYGISSEEALARINSLTDQEISLIAGNWDQLPAGGVLTPDQLALYVLIGVAIISLIITIIFYDDIKGDPVPGTLFLLNIFL